MKFTVTFRANTSTAAVVGNSDIGLDGLDWVRAELDVPRLKHALVNGQTNYIYENARDVELTERQAVSAGHFTSVNHAVVIVARAALNGFVERRVESERDEETGEVLSAKIVKFINTDAVVADWLIEGAPLEWEPAINE